MQSALLLNASYEPLRVIPWQRAISLWFSQKVEVVHEYEHDIRSVSLIIKAPAVVRLLSYVKPKKRRPPLCRYSVLIRDDYTCQYCSKSLTLKTSTLDHVIPSSKQGETSWTNLVACCHKCNVRKGSLSVKEANMRLLRKPTEPNWLPLWRFKIGTDIPKAWQIFLQPYE